MLTPKEKYLSDPEYHHLVQFLEQMIEQARFTPSELREACVLASINYEMRHIREMSMPPEVLNSLSIIEDFGSRARQKRNRG